MRSRSCPRALRLSTGMRAGYAPRRCSHGLARMSRRRASQTHGWRRSRAVWRPERRGYQAVRLPAMPSETESIAARLVRALNDASDGRPMQWREIEQLDGATADAVEFAAARHWVRV